LFVRNSGAELVPHPGPKFQRVSGLPTSSVHVCFRAFSRQLGCVSHAWREDHRRVSNGEQYLMIASAALAHPVSRQWKGYWRRSIRV